MNDHTYFIMLLIRAMYPLIVKIPVSGSLVGNSFHVNDSARLIRYSKFRKLSLKQRNMKYTKDLNLSAARLTLNLLPLT